jgi:maltose O-acetyltransferase
MKQYDLMINGKLYNCGDQELVSMRKNASKLCYDFNHTPYSENGIRSMIIEELFNQVGENPNIHTTFRCDYGNNINIGNNFFANYDCIIIDVAKVTIGNNVMFAPRVCLYTAGHPIDNVIRNQHLEYGLPIVIEDNVWVGGNVVINPGVTIGKNSIIGSGAVITHDIPENVVAVGNPCKVLRSITQEDKIFWNNKREEYLSLI